MSLNFIQSYAGFMLLHVDVREEGVNLFPAVIA